MAENKVIQVRGKNYSVYEFTGKVAHSNKQLETVVSGGGGGGATYTHDDIFLVNTEGQEQVIRLLDWNIATREGHEIQAIWLIKQGKDTGPYIIINNLTTNTVQWSDKKLGELLRLEWWRIFVVPIAILIIGGIILGWIVIFAVIAYFYFGVHKPWKDDIQSAKEQLKPFIQSA